MNGFSNVLSAFTLLGILVPATASAQILNNKTFVAHVLKYKDVKVVRDQFETKDELRDRLAPLAGSFVVTVPVDESKYSQPKSFKYDIDNGSMQLTIYADKSLPIRRVFTKENAPKKDGVVPAYVVENKKLSSRAFIGENSFGAKVRVSDLIEQRVGLVAVNLPAKNYNGIIYTTDIKMGRDVAKQLISHAAYRISGNIRVMEIDGAYAGKFAVYDGDSKDATVDSPFQYTALGYLAPADVTLIEVVNTKTNEVVATFKPES